MAAVNKNFVVKNGIEVGDNLIYGNKANLKVGIGTTVPGHTLDVRGSIGATNITVSDGFTFNSGVGTALNISGVGTITTLNATGAAVTASSSTWSQVGSGLTFTTGIGTNLFVSGIATVGSLSIGSTQVISSSRELQNIASLDATTTATIEAAIANAPNTFTDLTVSGIATFNSSVGVSGILTAANVRITGIATIGNIAFRSTGSSGGIVTAADNVGIITYYGDGSNLSGIGGAPGGAGSNTQVVYNSNGFFAGSSNFTFDGNNVYVAGIVTATDFNSLSDINYKDNVETVNNALLKVEQLRGVKFDWKESGRPSYGVIAQELEEVLPELVHGNDPKTVNYNGIIGVLIEAIKELQDEIAELKEKIDK